MACQEKFITGNEVPDEGGASVQDEEDEEGREQQGRAVRKNEEKRKIKKA